MSGNRIGDLALSKVGCPYQWGGAGPSSFDCSGLVYWCHQQVGISIPRTAGAQASSGSGVALSDWSQFQKGDVVFFDTVGSGRVTHCGISLGGSDFVHSSEQGKPVSKVTATPAYWKKGSVFKGGRRFW